VGGAPPVSVSHYTAGFDSTRDLIIRADGTGYVLDLFGGLHPVNGAPTPNSGPYWSGWDIARSMAVTVDTPAGVAGYILDGWGALHPFATGSLVQPPAIDASQWYQPGYDELTSLTMHSPTSGYVLNTHGAVYPIGAAPATDNPMYNYAASSGAAAYVSPSGYGFILNKAGGTKRLIPSLINDPESDPQHEPAQNRPGSLPMAGFVQRIGFDDTIIPMPPVPEDALDMGTQPLSGTPQTVDRNELVSWALSHTVHGQKYSGSGYRRMGNDCTNFLSRALDAAGWSHRGRGPGRDFVKTKRWFLTWPYKGGYSFTWSMANDFGLMMAATGWATSIVNWNKVKVGDIIQADDGQGRAYHTMLVTARDAGSTGKNGIKVTYHTASDGTDRENKPFVDFVSESGTESFYVWRLHEALLGT
jgi:hypothetical protein